MGWSKPGGGGGGGLVEKADLATWGALFGMEGIPVEGEAFEKQAQVFPGEGI